MKLSFNKWREMPWQVTASLGVVYLVAALKAGSP